MHKTWVLFKEDLESKPLSRSLGRTWLSIPDTLASHDSSLPFGESTTLTSVLDTLFLS